MTTRTHAYTQAAMLELCQAALDGVARGSDLHLLLASKAHARAAIAWGAESEQAAVGAAQLSRGITARYGQLSAPLVRQVVAAIRRRVTAAALAGRMGVLAWDMALESEDSGQPAG